VTKGERWQLEDPGYSVDKFYTQATDARGHSSDLHVRIPPDWARRLDVVFESRAFPYKTRSDIVRDALFHRLHHLSERLSPGQQDDFAVLESLQAEAQAYLDDLERTDKVIASLEAAVRRLSQVDPEEARRLIQAAGERIPAKAYLRRYFSRRIRELFPQWVEGDAS
jgi:hypothetical protein